MISSNPHPKPRRRDDSCWHLPMRVVKGRGGGKNLLPDKRCSSKLLSRLWPSWLPFVTLKPRSKNWVRHLNSWRTFHKETSFWPLSIHPSISSHYLHANHLHTDFSIFPVWHTVSRSSPPPTNTLNSSKNPFLWHHKNFAL